MVYVILMSIVSIMVAAFAMQNSVMVEVDFLFWNFVTSVAVVIMTSLFAGVFIAFCWGLKLKAQHYLRERKVQEHILQLENEKKALEEQINMLKYTQIKRNGLDSQAELLKK